MTGTGRYGAAAVSALRRTGRPAGGAPPAPPPDTLRVLRGLGALAVLGGSLLAGCGRERSGGDRADPAAAPAGVGAAGAAGAAPARAPGDTSGCPEDGRWRLCSVVDRLEDAGLVVTREPEPARHPYFSVPGTAFKVGRGALEVFVYPDPAAAARDVAALDTVRVAPKGASLNDWSVPRPTFIRSANLIAVFISVSETQTERVQLALGAGPPQPNPDTPR